MKKITTARITTLAAAVACSASALAADLTVISFGGANQEAQVKAFYKPWEAAGKGKIIAGEYNGEMAKVKAMVDTKSVTWNLVEVETPEVIRGCDEGMFEELEEDLAGNPEDFIEGAIQPCGVGFFVWSTVLAYNADKLSVAPSGWADFWDLKKFPGKRGLRKGAKFTLEFALLADGVSQAELYKVLATEEGQDRAFRKLDQIKSSIQWWEAGAQPPQFLMSGDVAMSSAYNGRIASVKNESNLKMVWNGGIYDFEYWAIPKGAKDLDQAKAFAAFTAQPEQQKTYVSNIPYGATNKKALAQLSAEELADMPTSPQNISVQQQLDVIFWADYGEQLEQRFNAWAAK